MASKVVKLFGCKSSKEFTDWVTSTHFWGPVCNWTLPVAAILDTQKTPEMISPRMTIAMACYSLVFMRFAIKVKPRNLFLGSVHVVNEAAQIIQFCRYLRYTFMNDAEREAYLKQFKKAD